MEKNSNTTELKSEWFEKAWNSVTTPEELRSFAGELAACVGSSDDSGDVHGKVADAASALAVASACLFARMFNMTAYQKGRVMWNIIDSFTDAEHDCGMKLVNFNQMLYPQYEDEFSKTLPQNVWDALQEKAAEILSEKGDGDLCDEVRSHLQSISDGNVPFGYEIKK